MMTWQQQESRKVMLACLDPFSQVSKVDGAEENRFCQKHREQLIKQPRDNSNSFHLIRNRKTFETATTRNIQTSTSTTRGGLRGSPPPGAAVFSYLLPLHDHRLGQRIVAPLLVGESLQVVQLRLQLKDQIFLLLSLSLQTFSLLPFSLRESHKPPL